MKIRTVKIFFKDSIKSIIRNRVMSLASISTVAAAIFIFGVFMLLAVNVNQVVSTVQSKIEVKAYLKKDVTTLKEQKIEKEIKSLSGVTNVTYESKEQALEKWKKTLGKNQNLAEGLEKDNPLPAAFVVKVDKSESIPQIAEQVAKIDGISEVNDGKDIVEKVNRATNFIKISSIVLMIILGIISMFLISNTIKITVYARKREISIMKYIGATDWFIRWPFILEGILLGFLGAIISIGFLSYGYNLAIDFVAKDIMIFSLVPLNKIIYSLAWQFTFIGMLIGGLGSFISLRKFLVV